ncbi:unnamed protein product [Bursaphelenchus okinawaensis]|uniref:WD_REPEATS_REGION domain-containing protein n=1 Tax=Bursaphelenchus okinawaensis TaxID=465554 RepID=A0A811K5M1_9BILA|nr:unnamed protein product [Bursaphelenchus okinawaensis]CAG9091767.1 unnamed protein product [Bursaphelenchus okinawaensis]
MAALNKIREIKRDTEFVDDFAAASYLKRRNRVRPYEGRYVNYVRSVSWNADGTLLAGGNYDNTHSHVVVGQLEPSSNRLKQHFLGSGHDDSVTGVAFHPTDPQVIASCSSDKTVRLWDVRVTKQHHRYISSDGNLALKWSKDGKFIVYIDKGDKLRVVDRVNMDAQGLYQFSDSVFDFVFHPSGNFIIACLGMGKIEIVRFPELTSYKVIQAHPPLSDCLSIDISPDGEYMAIGASDATCSVWDLQDMLCIRSIARMDYPIRTVSFSHCSNVIASGSEDFTIDLAWAENGNKVGEVNIPNECYALQWNPRLYLLAYATAPQHERERDPITFRVFGYPASSRRDD